MPRKPSPIPIALASGLSLLSLACGGPDIAFGGFGGGLLGLIVLVAWIVAIVQILQSGKDAGSKIVWILVVLLLPLIGTILWFIIGRK